MLRKVPFSTEEAPAQEHSSSKNLGVSVHTRVRSARDDCSIKQIFCTAAPHKQQQASWSRLCEAAGRPKVAKHIRYVIRTTSTTTAANSFTNATWCPTLGQRRALTWENDHPAPRYRDSFKPPIFYDEPSDSSSSEGEARTAKK